MSDCSSGGASSASVAPARRRRHLRVTPAGYRATALILAFALCLAAGATYGPLLHDVPNLDQLREWLIKAAIWVLASELARVGWLRVSPYVCSFGWFVRGLGRRVILFFMRTRDQDQEDEQPDDRQSDGRQLEDEQLDEDQQECDAELPVQRIDAPSELAAPQEEPGDGGLRELSPSEH